MLRYMLRYTRYVTRKQINDITYIFRHSHRLCQCIVHNGLWDFQCWLSRSFMVTSHRDTWSQDILAQVLKCQDSSLV